VSCVRHRRQFEGGVESESDSASEAKDGASLEGEEYEDRSVDGTDSAATVTARVFVECEGFFNSSSANSNRQKQHLDTAFKGLSLYVYEVLLASEASWLYLDLD
jgi:hypothetical protein